MSPSGFVDPDPVNWTRSGAAPDRPVRARPSDRGPVAATRVAELRDRAANVDHHEVAVRRQLEVRDCPGVGRERRDPGDGAGRGELEPLDEALHVVAEEEVARVVRGIAAASVGWAGHDRRARSDLDVVVDRVDVGVRGALLRVLGRAQRVVAVARRADGPLVAGPAVALPGEATREISSRVRQPTSPTSGRPSAPEREPVRVLEAARVDLRAVVGQVVVGRAHGMARQAAAVAIDVEQLARQVHRVVDVEGLREAEP